MGFFYSLLFFISEICNIIYIYHISQFRLAVFQMLKSPRRQVATVTGTSHTSETKRAMRAKLNPADFSVGVTGCKDH